MAITVSVVSAQTRTITGQVVYAGDGEPMIGASVVPIGGGQGAATNADGEFSLKVPASVQKIRVSFVGMMPQEVPVSNEKMLIKLTNVDNRLDEVMVVAYGTAKKSAYTGAASTIDASKIEDRLVSNLENALSGTMAGVQTTSANGQPGQGATIRIRGFGSINASMTPLYVLDGVPFDGDMAAINPNDIESMTVLKDAAAAALYGARGANGVILITTKSGSEGPAKITVDARWGATSRGVSNYDVINSPAQYMEVLYGAARNNAIYNLGYTPDAAHAYANSQVYDKRADGTGYGLTGVRIFTVPDGQSLIGTNGKINPNATLGWSDGQYFYTPDDWSDGTFRTGFRQEYNVSISGGNDRLKFYASFGYLDDEGIIRKSAYERFSTRTTIDYQAKKWLKIGTNMSYAHATQNVPQNQTSAASTGNAFMMANTIAPVYPMYVRDASGVIMTNSMTGEPIYDYGDKTCTNVKRQFLGGANPVGDLAYGVSDNIVDVFNGKWYAIINPLEGLTITGSVGLNVDNTRFHYLLTPLYGQQVQTGGVAQQQGSTTSALNLQALANYRRTFWEKHTFDVLLGYESYSQKAESLSALGYGLYKWDNWTVNNTLENEKRKGYGSYGEYATRGIFARLNYDYDNRYFFSASYRRDASSRFHPDHRWGNFFSVSAAWDLAHESFMENTKDWLDQLKVRGSYGQQGNDNIGNNYAYIDQYSLGISGGAWTDGELVWKGNPELTWEKSNAYNIGVDFSFKKGLVSGSIEYFSRETEDMLYNKPVSPSLGYSSYPMNIGSMRNFGGEFEVNVRPIVTRNITWELNANLTLLKNEVVKLAPELHGEWISGTNYYHEGQSRYQLYISKYAGVDKATGEALYWAAKTDADGNKQEYTTNNYTEAYNTNRCATGDLLPDGYGGFGTTLRAYGFDFSVQFAYQFGGRIFDSGYQGLMGTGYTTEQGKNFHKDVLNAWTPENPNSNIPRMDTSNSYSIVTSDRFLVSSNYLSLNNITIGYTFSNKIVKKLGLESLRVYGVADNLAIWSARKGLDPRQSYISGVNTTYSAVRNISGGVKVVF